MKKVIILGANGGTAREIVPRLLGQGDVELTLFARHPQRLRHLEGPHAHAVAGDARNRDDLKRAIQGQDIVISAMGGMDLGDKIEGVVAVMEELGVRRLIAISAGGIYDELPEPFNSWDKGMTGYTRPTNLKTAEVMERSSLDYTVLRPVWLTNKPVEEVELTRKGETFRGTETSRASLARFIADLVRNPKLHINENLGIAQPHTDGPRPAAYR
ncbi:SDR family oxidoreductase [Paenirhodobacter sp.]|uniref:SDR family oxidoreductase n=1 Tax=Paenirhodobacter sp. TaxID=1965326 RepID=UPI003B3ECB7E